ncbi:hypothetical protein QZH41_016549 [Actinostola sp. cb2023]|nr:hypothetical protein QZH41_016549 [Actinostola sp. cb2023]
MCLNANARLEEYAVYTLPIAQQDARNFIPDRYDGPATLINNDGTFSRQDPPPPPKDFQHYSLLITEDEQTAYDELNNGQDNNPALQQQNDYQSQFGQFGQQQAFNNFQVPGSFSPVAGQDQQVSYYNTQQYPREQFDETTADMPYKSRSEGDDISQSDKGENSQYSQQPQQYQNYQNYNDQPVATPQVPQQAFFDQPQADQQQQQQLPQEYFQPATQVSDDMQGAARDKPAHDDKVSDDDDISPEKDDEEPAKKSEILKARIKKYQVPNNLSQNDLQGMLGFGDQVYLRGGH